MSHEDEERGDLESVWRHVDPARGGAPPGFAARVMERVRAEAGTTPGWLAGPAGLPWGLAPAWAKAAAVVAAVTGLLAGAGLASWTAKPATVTAAEVAASFGEGFGEGYWRALENDDPAAWDLALDSARFGERP